MSSPSGNYPQVNNDGQPRRVGFEIEFIDCSLDDSVILIQNLFGGQIRQDNDHIVHVNETIFGQFTVERDLNLLKELSSKSIQNQESNRIDLEGLANKVLTKSLKQIVPIEIVTPPLLFNQISAVDQVIEELRKTSASDTKKIYSQHLVCILILKCLSFPLK